jgi:hypothetical protein
MSLNHNSKKIIALLFVIFSAKIFCQNMIIINSNNPNNVIALDNTSSAITPVLINNLSKIRFDSLDSNSDSKIVLGINENLEYDEFIIKSNNTSIFIEASNIKFLRYGVYTLLEIFGFKKFTSKVMYVPESNYLEFPKNFHKKYKPSFSYRGLLYPDVYDEQYRDWHKLDWYKEDFGIWGHSFTELLNPKELYNSNPEFYALYEGKRNEQSICMTNEDSFNLLVEEFEKKIINNPARYYSISQNDDVVYCECKSCKKLNEKHGGPQGSLYYFLNKIANKFPRIKITTLAYLHTFKPPINLEIAPNIITIVCPIDENKGKSYPEENNRSFLNTISNWQKTNQNLWIWDYMVQFSNYQNHFPNINTFSENLTFFHSKNVSGLFLQGSADVPSDFHELKQYILAKLMWDSNSDVAFHIQDFLRGYYGKAAPYISDYINRLEAANKCSNVFLDIYGGPVQSCNSYLSEKTICELDQILTKAERVVEDNEEIANRINKIRMSLEYIYFEQSKYYGTAPNGMFEIVDIERIVKPSLTKRVKNFVDYCNRNGIYEISEGGITPDQYYKNWGKIASNCKIHKAENLDVIYSIPPVNEYKGKSTKALTDGNRGTNDFNINWVGWYGTSPELELPTDCLEFTSLKVNFLEDQRHWIFLPSKIVVYGKLKNGKWKIIKKQNYDEVYENYEVGVTSFSIDEIEALRYESIKLKIKNRSEIPKWRFRKGKKCLLMIDEIELN